VKCQDYIDRLVLEGCRLQRHNNPEFHHVQQLHDGSLSYDALFIYNQLHLSPKDLVEQWRENNAVFSSWRQLTNSIKSLVYDAMSCFQKFYCEFWTQEIPINRDLRESMHTIRQKLDGMSEFPYFQDLFQMVISLFCIGLIVLDALRPIDKPSVSGNGILFIVSALYPVLGGLPSSRASHFGGTISS
jgi:hypothetical protein